MRYRIENDTARMMGFISIHLGPMTRTGSVSTAQQRMVKIFFHKNSARSGDVIAVEDSVSPGTRR